MYDSQHRISPQHFKQLRDAGEYKPFFSRLRSMTMKYHRKLIDRLDDTRNYGERISAHLINGKIHIFAEKYNYRFPEANEYYVMDYSEGTYTLSVFHHSAFMYLLMGEKEYKSYISQKTPVPIYTVLFRMTIASSVVSKTEARMTRLSSVGIASPRCHL